MQMAASPMEASGAAAPPLQRYQGVQKESAGYKLLASMGWQEGEGLGAAKQGIKEHIKVKKKFENWGVGAVEAAEQARSWSNGMHEFHRVLSTLSEVVSEHARRRGGASSEDEEERSDASDGETRAAKRAKKGGKRKQEVVEGAPPGGKKDKRSKRKRGGAAEAQADQQQQQQQQQPEQEHEEEQQQPQRVRGATHIGRFRKRENAKMVQNYSQHDLAAILGGDPFAAAAAAIAAAAEQQPARGSSDSSGSEPQHGQQRRGVPAAKPPTPDPGPAVAGSKAPKLPRRREPAASQQAEDTGEGRWWFGYFHLAGRMGSMRAAVQPAQQADGKGGEGITIHGFREEDQTALFNLAHDGATKGRVGLGRSSMPKMVAGARWEGTKQQLGSDSEEEEQEEAEEEEEAAAGSDEDEPSGVVIVMPRSKQQEDMEACKAQPQQGAQHAALARVKWKKAAAAALAGSANGRLKLAKLHRQLSREHGVPKAQRAAALQLLTAALQGSSKFALEGGVVRLAKVASQ